jgi:hypothetical protein
MRHTASLLVPGLESFHTLGGFGLILSHFENDPHHGHTIEAEIDGLTGFNMNPLGITAQEKDVGVRNHMIARSNSQPEIIVAQEFHGRTTIHLKAEMSKARSRSGGELPRGVNYPYGENGLQQLLAPDGFLRLFSEIAMSAKINGVSLPEISYTTPVDPPHSELLSSACERFLTSRGLPVRRKFGQPDGKRKEPVNPEKC